VHLYDIPTRMASRFLLGWLVEKIDRKLFEEHFSESDAVHEAKCALGNRLSPLYENLEFSLKMETPYSNKVSEIAIRNVGEKLIDRIEVAVEARDSYGILREQHLIFTDLGTKPKGSNLSNIPLVECWALENGSVLTSYDEFYVKVISIEQEGIKRSINNKQKIYSTAPSQYINDIFRKNWIRRWEKNYHIGLINRAKQRFGEGIYGSLNRRQYITLSEYKKLKLHQSLYIQIHSMITAVISFLITRDKILSFVFWSFLIVKQYRIDYDGNLQPKSSL